MKQYPSIHSQGFKTRAISKDRLLLSGGNRHFNASVLLTDRGTLIMAYRYHGADRGRCQIAICDLDSSMNPSNNFTLPLPVKNNMEHMEDPRLFMHKGAVYMSYIESSGYGGNWKCNMRLVRLRREGNDWAIDAHYPLAYGMNDLGKEKNWSFFSHDGKIYFVYSIKPHVVVEFDEKTGECGREWSSPGIINWQFGTLSGGTPPILYSGSTMLTMFHSALPHPERARRYNASFYMFSPVPPFEIRQVTEPVIYGAEEDGFMPDPRDHGQKHEPCVVFPCGSFLDNMGNITVSLGINDHGIAMVEIPMDRLKWLESEFKSGPRYFWTSNATRPLQVNSTTRLEWHCTRSAGGSWEGVMKTEDPNVVAMLNERDGAVDVREINEEQYALEFSRAR